MSAQSGSWNYDLTGQTVSLPDTTGSQELALSDGTFDSGISYLTLPFSFNFYNDTYTSSDSMCITTNGAIRFDDAMSRYSNGTSIPSSSATYGQMIQYGGTQDGEVTSSIKYKVNGSAPNRELVIVIPYERYSSSAATYSADIFVSLFEGTNEIRLQFNNVGTGTTTIPDHIGINAGDGVFGTSASSFPDVDTAFSFTVPSFSPIDAGIDAIYMTNTTQGTHSVEARIFNLGTSALTDATINWEVNGVAQTPFSYTGNIAQFDNDTVVIGTYNFNTAGDFTIEAWTSAPNAGTDGDTNNDSTDITVTMQKALDAGITNIFVSGSAAGSQTIEAEIKNYGTTALTTTSVAWAIDGIAQTPVTFNGNLAKNDIDTVTLGAYTFAAGSNTIEVSTVLTNDEQTNNDTFALVHNTYGAATIPFNEGFENGAPAEFAITLGSDAAILIDDEFVSVGDSAARFTGGGSTGFTGSGSTSATAYTWSSLSHRASADLIIDGSGQANIQMSFDLKQTYSYGAGYSNFRILVNGSPISDINGTINHQASTQDADPFQSIIYNLDAYAGGTFTITFQSECKYDDANYTSGIGDNVFVDNLLIDAPIMNDAGIVDVFVPTTLGSQTVEAEIKNFGVATLNTASINWSVDGVVQTPFNFTGSIASYETDTVAIGVFNFSVGQHTVKVWTSNPNNATDGDGTNDTLEVQSITFPSAHTFPLTEGFESGMFNFSNETINTVDFAINTMLVSSGSKSVLNAHGNNNLNYLTETADIDLTNTTAPLLKFMHIAKTEGGYDKCFVQVSTDGGATYTDLTSAEYQGAASDFATKGYFHEDSYSEWGDGSSTVIDNSMWKEEVFSLANFKEDSVRVRFFIDSDGSGNREGWYIDDISLEEALMNDLMVSEIIVPTSNPCGNAAETVDVVFKNVGIADQTNVAVKLIVGGAINDTLTSTVDLLAGETDTITFATFNASTGGTYTLEGIVLLSGDQNTSNDTLTGSFEVYSMIATPYFQDFDIDYSEWNKGGFSRGNTHGLSSYGLYKNLWSSSTSAEAWMLRKITGITAQSILTFDYRMVDFTSPYPGITLDGDSLIISISTDCGTTFTSLHVIDTFNHVVSDFMAHVEVPMGAYAGQDIMLKIKGVHGNDDYYLDIDNIGISEPVVADLGNDTGFCVADSVQLIAGTEPTYTYVWRNLNGDSLTSGMAIYVDTAASYVVNITSPQGFADADTVVVVEYAAPTASFSGLNAEYCEAETAITLVPTPAGGVFSGNGITGLDFEPATAGPGNHTITYTYTDGNACVATDVQSVNVGADFTFTITADHAICDGETTTIEALTTASAAPTDIFFTEYMEGSGNNKALEIYNGTDTTVYLDNYALASVGNDPNTPGAYEFWTKFTSGDTIAAGDVYVVAHPSANAEILAQADMTHQYLSNGDDGYALVKNDGVWDDVNANSIIDEGEMTGYTTLDFIGDFNGDPGSGWDVAGIANGTKDHTLVRKMTVTAGNSNWTAAAGTDSLSAEWLVYPKDSLVGLGAHNVVVFNYSFAWSNGVSTSSQDVTPTATTNYIVTVSDICSVVDSVEVTVNALPTLVLSAPDTVCIYDVLTVDATAGFTNYLWNDNSTGASLVVPANTNTAGQQNYSVTVTDANGCEATDDIDVEFDECVGMNELNNDLSYVIYPNPTSGLLNIAIDGTTVTGQINVVNAAGQLVISKDVINENNIQLDLTSMAKGVYYIRIVSEHKTLIEKVIVD